MKSIPPPPQVTSSNSSMDSSSPRPKDLAGAEGGVSVERAEAEFAQLSREFSSISHQSKKLAKVKSHVNDPSEKDVERYAGSSSDSNSEPDAWNLEQALRGQRDEADATGIKPKRIGVIWDGLTVSGIGGVKNIVKTFPEAFVSFLNVPETLMHIFGYGKKGKEIDILQNFRGVAKPGEMVLVLGRPGSGCTTFLKVIANQRFGYTNVAGEVLYGPYTSKTFENKFRGEAVYNGEDDIHHPTLSVGQTLGFALDVKTPGKRPGNISKEQFKEKVINLLLKMFNIEHTINTIVGNPFVRGISGGERKRVSIAEMMVTSACVCTWDNTTRVGTPFEI